MDEYGLLGFPLGHSFSQSHFKEKFDREGIDADYLNFEIADIAEVHGIIDAHPHL
ncbi:MAG: shikimate dehydrogenase, partial [Bacteroidaceae bacterium]|nr:shikimate dehydrogenase [Bacteroidaceae bacterium]